MSLLSKWWSIAASGQQLKNIYQLRKKFNIYNYIFPLKYKKAGVNQGGWTQWEQSVWSTINVGNENGGEFQCNNKTNQKLVCLLLLPRAGSLNNVSHKILLLSQVGYSHCTAQSLSLIGNYRREEGRVTEEGKGLERENWNKYIWDWLNVFQVWNLHVSFCYILKSLICHFLGFGKQWPMEQIWLLLTVVNQVLLEHRYTHSFMHVYGCFCSTTTELRVVE